ncbi:uncharacterized protein LOC141610522 [Silene latifolia]|uniref:uncharacterized protein LOC141610522 n=1 Tax=Silene latifolia TaxID=37657 RepID=UPI003D77AA82
MGEGRKNKKKKRGGAKRKMTVEQTLALKSINEWVHLSFDNHQENKDGFLPDVMNPACFSDKIVFELHSHSICSDGYLSPSALVERAHHNGVKVLALTDHDTMAGIPEALGAARKFGIKIIPGVEISTLFSARDNSDEEPVHILAYYSSCGPSNFDEFDKFLADIRDGRYIRAKNMLSKLNKLKMPVKWEHVTRIAGSGVAPGRLHVARAMVEAGHVEDLKQAFARYLYDDGPAYSKGSEPCAEEAVQFIRKTGGVSVLAHPWSLKNSVPIISRLSEAGLHGIEAYRSDGKLAVYSDLADTYGLLKLGGSDYHARGGHTESPLGSVSIPVLAIRDFLKLARPIWRDAIRDTVEQYIRDPSDLNLKHITRFTLASTIASKGDCGNDGINRYLSSWLTREEMQHVEFQTTLLKLSEVVVNL